MKQRIRFRSLVTVTACAAVLAACGSEAPRAASTEASGTPGQESLWNAENVYFLLLDRFANGDPANDTAKGRQKDGAVARYFMGGDLKGVLEKVESGYFDSLGVTMLWTTPFYEQINGTVSAGGKTYGFHGYWPRDWTRVDPAYGTDADLKALVEAAHRHGIRVLMDAIVNHTGPVTDKDPVWPQDWVRTDPLCEYDTYESTVDCQVADLPDIRTDRDEPVDLPPELVEKWTAEGRLEQERAELDAFFERTGYPRAPRYYIIKWLTDWVRELGIDGYRVDTAKHFEPGVSDELRAQADIAFADWKQAHPGQVLDDRPFYMVGEVYGYAIENGRDFDYGDRVTDFFSHGYDALINMQFKTDARGDMEEVDSMYAAQLEGPLAGKAVLNYVDSHDDGDPYDQDRADPMGSGTRLLLAPGASQIYYGDEVGRPLRIEGAEADANLRSMMDWSDVQTHADVLEHWRKLGRFRHDHPAVGAGAHTLLQETPLVFGRVLSQQGITDKVVVALDQPVGIKSIPVGDVFPDGAGLTDAYSGESTTVVGGHVTLDTPFPVVLLASGG